LKTLQIIAHKTNCKVKVAINNVLFGKELTKRVYPTNETPLVWNYMNYTMKNKFYQYIQNLQDQIVAGLEAVEGQS
jgi:hypothetical protein